MLWSKTIFVRSCLCISLINGDVRCRYETLMTHLDFIEFNRIQKVIFLAVHNIKPNSSFPQSESKRIQSIASTLIKIIV